MASWEEGEELKGQTWKKGSISTWSEGGRQGVVWEQKCVYVRKTEKSHCRGGTQLGEVLKQSGRCFWSGQEKVVTGDVCSKAVLCLFRHKWQRETQRSKFRACIKKKLSVLFNCFIPRYNLMWNLADVKTNRVLVTWSRFAVELLVIFPCMPKDL